MRSDMDHTVLPANYTMPGIACLYSPAAEHHRPSAPKMFDVATSEGVSI